MRKMRLEIDNLQVESFEVREEAPHLGTVYGNVATRGDCSGTACPGSGMQYSCNDSYCDYQSCVVLCPYTYHCEEMTDNTCAYTCDPCDPTYNEAASCQIQC